MQTSGNFLAKNPPNYFCNTAVEFQRVVYSEKTLNVDNNYKICRISRVNTSNPWNISGNITIQNLNNSANCRQAVTISNGQENFGVIRSYVNQAIFKQDITDISHHPASKNGQLLLVSKPASHQHTESTNRPSKVGSVPPIHFQKPDFRLPHSEIDHYLSPPAYHNLQHGKLGIPHDLPSALMPPPSYPASPAPQMEIVPALPILATTNKPHRQVAPSGEYLTESEIDNWVSKIAEEANSHDFVVTWPEKGRPTGGGDERDPRATVDDIQVAQQPRRLRKQAKPRCSAQRYDPNFKGMVVEMHIKRENRQCQLRIKSSLGVKLSSLRLDEKHPVRRSCCSIDEQPSGRIRVVRPQGGKRVLRYSKECQSCGARRTQLWRKSENGKLLCNMCGIRYMKYRVRCRRCWHVPKCNSKLHSKCGCCGSSLCYVVTKQNMIHCKPQ